MIKAKFAKFKFKDFSGFSSTFKHLICFQALSRALKFLFQIQVISRISQARCEPWYMQYPQLDVNIRWHDFVRNADICRITNQPPLSSIKSRHLTFFGHLV